jgi:hypothetical protein
MLMAYSEVRNTDNVIAKIQTLINLAIFILLFTNLSLSRFGFRTWFRWILRLNNFLCDCLAVYLTEFHMIFEIRECVFCNNWQVIMNLRLSTSHPKLMNYLLYTFAEYDFYDFVRDLVFFRIVGLLIRWYINFLSIKLNKHVILCTLYLHWMQRILDLKFLSSFSTIGFKTDIPVYWWVYLIWIHI